MGHYVIIPGDTRSYKELTAWDSTTQVAIEPNEIGGYAWRTRDFRDFRRDFPEITTFRASFMFYRTGDAYGGDRPPMIRFQRNTSSSSMAGLYKNGGGDWELIANGNVVHSFPDATIPLNTWVHIAFDVSPSWVALWVDGNHVYTYNGTVSDPVGTVIFGGLSTADRWYTTELHFDDFYIDLHNDAQPQMPEPRRFLAAVPVSTAVVGWNGSDGDQVDNHLLVDELPEDDDATYVYTTAPETEELYTITAPTTPPDMVPRAVHVMATARKDAGDVQLAGVVDDGTNRSEAPAVVLGTSYTQQWFSFDATPAGGGWSNEDPGAYRYGVRSKGTFA